MSKTAGSDPAPTAPAETRSAMVGVLTEGIDAQLAGKAESDCPYPATGPRPVRMARMVWLDGFRTTDR
jgi:ribosome modulation factor